ncbi:aspartic and glutamic acid-rich protein-like [Anneissia japonica]|uniref:aspartic and glutamic acid-rich protein-like n=1 Tax=Anneissia japonica TaxID=1529436 RepID=UPI00142561F5|nr:aspartic and glutamic acid-rich protein-like [Anneissia japonica]
METYERSQYEVSDASYAQLRNLEASQRPEVIEIDEDEEEEEEEEDGARTPVRAATRNDTVSILDSEAIDNMMVEARGDVEEEEEEEEGENYEDDDDRTVVDETEDVHVTTVIDSFLNTPEFQAPEEPESPAYDLFDDSEESRWVFNVPTPGGGGGGQQQQPEENAEEREIETESLVKQVESMQREKDMILADAKNNLKRTQEELAEAKSAAERAKTEFHESRMSELEDRMKEQSDAQATIKQLEAELSAKKKSLRQDDVKVSVMSEELKKVRENIKELSERAYESATETEDSISDDNVRVGFDALTARIEDGQR